MFLRVALMKGVMRFEKKKKLSSTYISLFKILEKIRVITYKLALLLQLSTMHDIFHISILRKCIPIFCTSWSMILYFKFEKTSPVRRHNRSLGTKRIDTMQERILVWKHNRIIIQNKRPHGSMRKTWARTI